MQATNYYFSSTVGNDSRSIAEAQNPSTPWRSVTKLNSLFTSLLPGDTVFLKRGDVFEGKLTLPRSGSAGKPIVLAAFGSGEKPVISGFSRLSNFSLQSGKIWGHSLNVMPSVVLINDRQHPIGRKPNSTDAGGGYRYYDSYTSTSINDADLQADPNWNGADVVIRKNRWIIDRCPVVSHSGGFLSFQNTSQYLPSKNFGYFIQNHIGTLDQHGEWAYDKTQRRLSVFFTNYSAANTRVSASTVDVLLDISKQRHISLLDLAFTGANETAISLLYSGFISLEGCSFSYAGLNAVFMNYTTDVRIEDCVFENMNNNGVTTQFGCANLTIHNNAFRNTAVIPGMGKNGDLGYQALTIKGKNNRITENVIENTGYIPIRFEGDQVVIQNNFIDNFCTVKDDGAGIYTWNNDANAPENTGRIVKDNIVLNGLGAGAGTSYPDQRNAHGIYLDDNAANVEITGNTVAHCSESGIYIHNSRKSVLRNNTLYNNEKQLYFQHDNVSPNNPIRSLDVKQNILFSKEDFQHSIFVRSIKNDVAQFGNSDSNYINQPFSRKTSVYTSYRKNYNEYIQAYDLNSWQGAFGKDGASKDAPLQWEVYKNNGTVGGNKVINSTFDKDVYNVYGYYYSGSYNLQWNNTKKLDGGSAQITLNQATDNRGWIIMDVGNVRAGKTYVLRFSMIGTSNNKSIGTFLRQKGSPYTRITDINYSIVKNSRTENEVYFVAASDQSASLVFDFSDQGTIWLDNIQLHEASRTKVINPDDQVRFEYNATKEVKKIMLDGSYVDPRNRKFSGSVALAPFTSLVLLKTGTAERASQTIAADSLAAATFGDEPRVLSATASSGLPVTYRVVSGPATVSDNQLTITGAGVVLLELGQPGNDSFLPAEPVTISLQVAKSQQSISFRQPADRTAGDEPFSLDAEATSGLPVSFRVVEGSATIEGNMVKVGEAGTVLIEAEQPGNDDYLPAAIVRRSFEVAERQGGKRSQTIKTGIVNDVEFGAPPFLLNATATSGLPVSYKLLSGPASLLDNQVTVTGAGEVVIEADQEGNDVFETAEPATIRFQVLKAAQSISFATLRNKKTTDEPFAVEAVASSALPVRFSIISGPATLNGNTVVLQKEAGIVVVEAAQDGDDNFGAAEPVRQSFTVSEIVNRKQNQSISFGTQAYRGYNSPVFELTATATSGLPVYFRLISGPVTIHENMVNITGVGNVVVEATQPGNDEYDMAPPVQRLFTIGKGGQTLSFPNIPNRRLSDGPLTLKATSSASLPVSYRVISGPAVIENDVVTFSGAGLVTIEASQEGNEFYTPSFPLYRIFAVTSSGEPTQRQTIDFPSIGNTTFGNAPIELKGKASSGLPVSYQVISGPAVIAGNKIRATGAGTVVVEASQYGNSVFMPAPVETRTFTVRKAEQEISFGTLSYQTYGSPAFSLAANASSGLPVYYRVVSGPVRVEGNKVTITGVGNVVIEANQPGNDDYRVAKAVQRGFTVGRGSQIINFPQLANRSLTSDPIALNGTSSSGLAVQYKVVSGRAKISGSHLLLTGTGVVVVEANQPGNALYAPAFALQRTFTVSRSANADVTLTEEEVLEELEPEETKSAQKKAGSLLPQTLKSSVQVWPNPMRTAGHLRITLAQSARADVEVFDNSGRLVKRIAGRSFDAGQATVLPLPVDQLPAGVYYVRVASGKELLTQVFQVSK